MSTHFILINFPKSTNKSVHLKFLLQIIITSFIVLLSALKTLMYILYKVIPYTHKTF